MRNTLCAGVLTIGLLWFSTPPGASAGTLIDPNLGDNVLGKTGGVRYAIESAANDPMSGPTSVVVGCGGPRWHVVGGGYRSEGPAAQSWEASSRPYDFDDADVLGDDGWMSAMVGPPGSQVTGYSICVRDGEQTYPIRMVPASTEVQRLGSVRCAGARWHVTAGSAFIDSTGSWVKSSFPKDGRDAGSAPDDGWTGVVYDAFGGISSFEVFAICVADVHLRYARGTPSSLVAGSAVTSSVACAAGEHVVGGGVRVSGPAVRTHSVSSSPFDGPDDDDVPDDGWQTRTYSISGPDKLVTPFAICLR